MKRPKNNKEMMTKLESFRFITVEGCWIWTGSRSSDGYGRVRYKITKWQVHRLSLYLYKPSEFIEGLQINHKCNRSLCFNPDHLYCGTQKDNMRDKLIAGNNTNASKTYCKRGHEFTPENTYIDLTRKTRSCKICKEFLRIFRSV